MRAGTWLHGAWLLARGQPIGLALLAVPAETAADITARSFWALILSIPAFVALQAMGWLTDGLPPDALDSFTRGLLSLIVGWLGFVALMHPVCRRMGRARLWPRFVVAWNWCSLLQALMLVAAAIPGVLGAPDWLGQTAGLVALGWSLWLGWFVARLTLGLGAMMAVAVVGLDLSFELLVSSVIGG